MQPRCFLLRPVPCCDGPAKTVGHFPLAATRTTCYPQSRTVQTAELCRYARKDGRSHSNTGDSESPCQSLLFLPAEKKLTMCRAPSSHCPQQWVTGQRGMPQSPLPQLLFKRPLQGVGPWGEERHTGAQSRHSRGVAGSTRAGA